MSVFSYKSRSNYHSNNVSQGSAIGLVVDCEYLYNKPYRRVVCGLRMANGFNL